MIIIAPDDCYWIRRHKCDYFDANINDLESEFHSSALKLYYAVQIYIRKSYLIWKEQRTQITREFNFILFLIPTSTVLKYGEAEFRLSSY